MTVKLCDTGMAALYCPVTPGCEAVIVQSPVETKVTVLFETLHTPEVDDAKITVNPELAVACNARVVPTV
jgi:hypothetical protein